MSKYTTGELAKLCGISVRTVQYYDTRGILCPSELSEGGRRLYTEADLAKMKTICFLRELDLPLDSIGKIMKEENSGEVISLILGEQAAALKDEIAEKQKSLEKLEMLDKAIKNSESFSFLSIGDVASTVQGKDKLSRLHFSLLVFGLPITILEWVSVIFWIATGAWWLFAIYLALGIPFGIWISSYYFHRVAYICPECHKAFKPSFKEALFSNHTPTARKLTCAHCGKKGFCVEIYRKENN